MVQKRRVGAESSETRARIVDAAEQVIRDEGYAAASSRRVALRAQLPPSLVHYYFPTTDDLLLAVFRRGAAQSDVMIEQALGSDDPVRALWRFFADASRTALAMEFVALANHRKTIQAEIARHSDAMRARQADLLERLLGDRLAAYGLTAAGLGLLLAGVGRTLVMEGGLGVSAGHDEARASVEAWLDRLLS
ncbi:TetR/AcrR family transcriptional regulator [Sphingobium boeckii]|uniref:AcrR family transcriptional regulator n=1 Tax=Sphingobium boeckii TaxID=1082345 RepID=A0A7W9AJG7_9SPHN|nr:TetR/AcrR family transcriptional regulator [Sphingobium boeckii]MBB5686698.1 AcrR family transcriptional regulator [Sphingobium boeckii]